MSAKAVREYHGKKLLCKYMKEYSNGKHVMDDRSVLITPTTDLERLTAYANNDPTKTTNVDDMIDHDYSWLVTTKLVVKPDQLIKRRGKLGLVGVNMTWDEVQEWITERMEQEIIVESVNGELNHFIVEPYVKHTEEYYICIQSDRDGEEILFYSQGGVNVGDVDANATRWFVEIDDELQQDTIYASNLLDSNNNTTSTISEERKVILSSFITTLFQVYRKLNFTYMEINPIVFVDTTQQETSSSGQIQILDLAAKIDETASFLNASLWGHLDFPSPFGRKEFTEEAYIRELDSKTGASLKLTILNHTGRIWTMVAGGGASVVYADTISDLGYGHELANYGEYSGAPSTEHTFEYAKTLIGLMTREKDPRGKIFIIGGGIANFTDVAATFTGLIKAIKAHQDELRQHHVSC